MSSQQRRAFVQVEPGSFRVQRPASGDEVMELAKKNDIQIVDLRFIDVPGLWQHFSIGLPELHKDLFEEGIGFDGSSIRGFQEIHESDMLLKPDPTTAFLDPMCEVPTLVMICDVVDPVLRRPYSRDPRYIAKKAEAYLRQTGIADTCYFGPELEFFIFDSIRFEQNQHCGYYYVEAAEGEWNSGRDEGAFGGGNLGYKPRYKEGYFPVPPHDTLQDIRSQIMLALMDAGIQVEVHHHEVATGGQGEINVSANTLTKKGDEVQL
ncbi:MAG: glutamine synthetase beta-grasp domain-containing protein, partial [Betaproteobacteria bacterium]|nr:glutamine synthetase beta-grasp domain-containing protein [Betaproteobacteria bacterium]